MTQNKENLDQINQEAHILPEITEDLFSNPGYICKSTPLIADSLQKGFDVVQMPNGDVIITEIKVVNVQYSWDHNKQKMVKIGQN